MMDEAMFIGPLFNGHLKAEIRLALDGAEREIAQHVHSELEAEFHAKFQNPTGYYESQVQVRDDPEGVVVSDGGVIYGPWLEGTGTRNATTRFKGYSIFRRTAQKAEVEAYGLVRTVMAKVARRG